MKMWKSIVVVAMLVTIGALGYAQLGSAQEGKSIEQMVSEAKTPADYEAIAVYYDQQAQEAHQKHAEHQKLVALYDATPKLKGGTMAKHCTDAGKKYEGIAKDYEALAKAHREMAKAAK